MPAPDLFSPFRLGPLPLPNRAVMAPMTRNRAGAGNAPTALNAAYYAQRAGAGLIVTEASQVSPQGVGYPGTPGIHSAVQIAGWRLRDRGGARRRRADFLAALACRAHLASVIAARRRAAGGAVGDRAGGAGLDARRHEAIRRPARARNRAKFPASSSSSGAARRMRKRPALTASRCTPRTATCSISFCATRPTGAPTVTAAARKTAPASSSR